MREGKVSRQGADSSLFLIKELVFQYEFARQFIRCWMCSNFDGYPLSTASHLILSDKNVVVI